MAVSCEPLENALNALGKALELPKDDIVRDAAIQRFEFTLELAWKTAKRAMGTSSTAPKVVVREMAQQKLIENPDLWMDFIESRNLSSHTYKEEIAERVFQSAKSFHLECKKLIAKIKKI